MRLALQSSGPAHIQLKRNSLLLFTIHEALNGTRHCTPTAQLYAYAGICCYEMDILSTSMEPTAIVMLIPVHGLAN